MRLFEIFHFLYEHKGYGHGPAHSLIWADSPEDASRQFSVLEAAGKVDSYAHGMLEVDINNMQIRIEAELERYNALNRQLKNRPSQ